MAIANAERELDKNDLTARVLFTNRSLHEEHGPHHTNIALIRRLSGGCEFLLIRVVRWKPSRLASVV